MIRAFHQLDWRKEGRILRQDVVDAWEPVTVTANAKISASNLLRIAKKGDSNQDGEIDRSEFINICDTILEEIKENHEQSLQKLLTDSRAEASSENESDVLEMRLSHPAQAPLPWGWECTTPTSFHDIVTDIVTSELPDMPATSLSCMAYMVAPKCLDRIRQFMDAYRIMNLVENRAPEPRFQNALEIMKRSALKFAVLEDPTALETSNSDLDKIIAECRIVHAVEPDKSLIEDCPVGSLSSVVEAYESLLLDVLSFVRTMTKVYDFDLPHPSSSREVSAGLRDAFGQSWTANRMEQRARLVGKKLAAWGKIEEDVQICRDWYKIHPELYEEAFRIAHTEFAAEADKLMIKAILDTESPIVRLKILSARDLPKVTKWGVSKLPSPFARLHTSQEEFCHTDTVQRTTWPCWAAPWATVPLGPANSSENARITISTSTSDGGRLDIANTLDLCVDKQLHQSSDSSRASVPLPRDFQGHSLYEPFSGRQMCRYIWQS